MESHGEVNRQQFPDNIFISSSILENFECALNDGTQAEANWWTFWTMFTIAHESSHYCYAVASGNQQENLPQGERGAALEQILFGKRFSYKLNINAKNPGDYAPNLGEVRVYFETEFYPMHKKEFDRLFAKFKTHAYTPDSQLESRDPSLSSKERDWETRKPGFVVGQKIECGDE